MKKIDRYIGRHVLMSIGIVMLVVVGIDLLSAFVDEMQDTDKGHYTGMVVAQYLLLTIPRRIYEFIPMSALVGCLIGLGSLATHSELTIIRASGVSTLRIVWSVFKPVLALMIVALALGQFVVPPTQEKAISLRAVAQANDGVLRLDSGAWHRDANTFIHIAAVEGKRRIHGVTRYQFDDQGGLLRTSYAQQGTPIEDGWELKNVRSTRFVDGHTEVSTAKQETWHTGLTPRLLSIIMVEPDDLSTTGLWSYAHYLNKQGVDASNYQLAFWKKMLLPLSIGALVLIGVSFIFGPLRNVTAGQRIIAGVIAGIAFKFAQDMLGPASSVFGFSPLLAVMVPVIICVLIGTLLMRKAG